MRFAETMSRYRTDSRADAETFLRDLPVETHLRFLEAGAYVLAQSDRPGGKIRKSDALHVEDAVDPDAVCRRVEELLKIESLRRAAPVFHWIVARSACDYKLRRVEKGEGTRVLPGTPRAAEGGPTKRARLGAGSARETL